MWWSGSGRIAILKAVSRIRGHIRRLGRAVLTVRDCGLGALLVVTGAAELCAEAPRTDLALVLAVDISYSIENSELDLQRQGYVDAFRSREVVRSIVGGYHGRIAVTYLEWAGPGMQVQLLPWTIIDSVAASSAFADQLEAAPLHRSGETSIASGLDTAAALFASAPPAARWVIDLSADGYNNSGGSVSRARDAAVWKGITINGLPIVKQTSEDLELYFQDCVIGGPAAALFPVFRIEDFAKTLQRKMVTEISGRHQARPMPARVSDCAVGERRARENYLRQLDSLTGGKSERWRLREEDWPSVD